MRNVLLTSLFLAWACSTAFSQNRDEALRLFVRADLAYKDAKYEEAAKLYEQIVAGDLVSGPTFYNLGNCYFKLGKVGKAILNYERSRRLMPRDADLRANLRYAQTMIQGAPALSSYSFFDKIADPLGNFTTPDEILLIFFLVLFLVAAAHSMSLFFPFPFKGRAWAWGVGAFLAILLAGVFLISARQHAQAIVVAPSSARFEPREQATAHFELYEGQKVWIIDQEGLWRKIRRSDGKIGWVVKEKIEQI